MSIGSVLDEPQGLDFGKSQEEIFGQLLKEKSDFDRTKRSMFDFNYSHPLVKLPVRSRAIT